MKFQVGEKYPLEMFGFVHVLFCNPKDNSRILKFSLACRSRQNILHSVPCQTFCVCCFSKGFVSVERKYYWFLHFCSLQLPPSPVLPLSRPSLAQSAHFIQACCSPWRQTVWQTIGPVFPWDVPRSKPGMLADAAVSTVMPCVWPRVRYLLKVGSDLTNFSVEAFRWREMINVKYSICRQKLVAFMLLTQLYSQLWFLAIDNKNS